MTHVKHFGRKSTAKRLLLSSLCLLSFAGASLAQTANPEIVDQGFIYKGAFGGHAYYLTATSGSWTSMETKATTIVGAHLVSVNTPDENNFICGLVPADQLAWIGFTDQDVEGDWKWTDNSPVSYTNWFNSSDPMVPSQPDNWNNQNYAVIHSSVAPGGSTFWDDAHNSDVTGLTGYTNNFMGIVEVVPPSCNSNSSLTAATQTIYLGYNAQSTNLTATAPVGSTFKWIGANTGLFSDIATQVFTPTTAGDFTFTVVVSGAAGCADVISTTVKVIDIRELVVDPKTGKDVPTGKVWICHNGTSTSVAPTAAASHLSNPSHNDQLGKCPTVATMRSAHREMQTQESTDIKVYPNPTQNAFFVEVPHTEEVATVTVLDIQGKVLETRTVNANDNRQVRFDLENSPRGLYIIEVTSGAQRFHSKIVLQ